MVTFSLLVAYYQGIDADGCLLQRFVDSLKAQTYKDFEVIVCHDGQYLNDLKVDIGDLKVTFLQTSLRANLWGHNLRSLMMRRASGDYFLNTNADNVYYPDALQELHSVISQHQEKVFIGGVKMMGMRPSGDQVYYDSPRDYNYHTILKGNPSKGLIDMMQLVAHRSVWESIGYWYLLGEDSDGSLYELICQNNDYVMIKMLLGEHY
jgi:glycosyltransferase involved in cell wall biosynthesis